MLTKEQLNECFELANKFDNCVKTLEQLGITCIDSEPWLVFYRLFDLFIESHYTDEGFDWIVWWFFENDCGKNNLEAVDENGNEICKTFDDLFSYVEQYKK